MDLSKTTAETTRYGRVNLTTFDTGVGATRLCWRDENEQRVSLFYKTVAEAQNFLRINK